VSLSHIPPTLQKANTETVATMGVLIIWHRKQPKTTCVSETLDVKFSLSQARTQNFSLGEGCLTMRLYIICVWFKGSAVKMS
jgi:hypothetical protein